VETSSPDLVHDDLKGIIKGELLFDGLTRALYSTDASVFQIEPLGVVAPLDEADLQALVRYAGEHQLSLVARGAGTGVAGESLGAGLIVDLSRHFRQIVEIGSDSVRVQPGVVLRELKRQLAAVGRRFAPDPALVECTLGGMLATNASGMGALRHGYTRDHVARLRLVLDSGDVTEVGRQSPWPTTDPEPSRLQDIVSSLATLLQPHADLIRENQPRTAYNRCGYQLQGVLSWVEGGGWRVEGENNLHSPSTLHPPPSTHVVDLPRLLVGSEGTLALFTEATLRTIPLPAGRAVALLGFASVEAALRVARLTLPTCPAACELIDRRLLRLARGIDAIVATLVPAATETVLLVEYEADSPAAARRAAADLADRCYRLDRVAQLALVVSEPAEIDRCWQIREAALPSLYGLRGTAQPLGFIEDVGVPVEVLPEYLRRVQELLQRHETTASYLIHAGTGQVHMQPFMDLQRPDEVVRMWTLAEETYNLVLELGGTISSQHGTGLARTPWVSQQYGPLFPVFRGVKAIFDPRYLFNPGKIVGPTPGRQLWPLRVRIRDTRATWTAEEPSDKPDEPQHALRWAADELIGEVVSCNGCGQCRTESVGDATPPHTPPGTPSQRMCPLFRVNHDEAATPRAKANMMRHVLDPRTDSRALSSGEVRSVADLCINCKMCARECPAHVNIPKLMLEAKAANVAQHGMDRAEWALARTEMFARLGSALAPVANALLGNGIARWVLEQLIGISRMRRLPAFSARSFMRQARQRGWTRKPRSSRRRVAYFVDVFANYNDPSIGEAVVAVLHHNGIEVYVPEGQKGCGMAPLAHGDVETARETLQSNLRVLADLAREGYPILCSEPTAALMLRQDALDLLDDPDVHLVASQTVEFTAFLWDLYQQGRLRTDFQKLEASIGHHVPCHLKALGGPAGGGIAPSLPAGPCLLSLIPGMKVHTIDVSCSGMAGTYGLSAANYSHSLAAGRPLLQELSRPRVLFGSTECSTCRMQMEDGAGKRTLHPAQYLALAYGLMPQILQRLHQPVGKRVLR
jgi:FAD/FMN-containing dehydrogenase/Fe-S oxidoreductase